MGKGGRVTLSDIAKELGISPSTVSTALTGRRNGVFVSADTRARVVEVAREMGYPLRNLRARQPKIQRIAVFHRMHQHSVFAGTILELCSLLNRQDYRILIYTAYGQLQQYGVAQELYRRYEIDAAVFVGSRNTGEYPDFGDMPTVVIGELPEGMQAWRVSIDNHSAVRMVAEHLWYLGHRRVGMILPGGDSALTGGERLNGLRSVWEERNVPFRDEWVLPIDWSTNDDELLAGIQSLLDHANRRGEPLTGLFCYNDWLAGRAMKILKHLGFRIPADVSVVGFDDYPNSDLLDPPLTTVHQPFQQLGALAAQLLLEYCRSAEDGPKAYIAAGKLVVRDSTGPARC